MERKLAEKRMIDKNVDYLVKMLNTGQFMALSKIRGMEYPYSLYEKEIFIKSLISPRNLTCDRLEDVVIDWWMNIKSDNELLLQDEADKLIELLKDSIVEVAREAYERGKRGEQF